MVQRTHGFRLDPLVRKPLQKVMSGPFLEGLGFRGFYRLYIYIYIERVYIYIYTFIFFILIYLLFYYIVLYFIVVIY